MDVIEQSELKNTVAAVYSLVPNGTLQFTFVDDCYTELHFNSFFIDKYQQRFR